MDLRWDLGGWSDSQYSHWRLESHVDCGWLDRDSQLWAWHLCLCLIFSSSVILIWILCMNQILQFNSIFLFWSMSSAIPLSTFSISTRPTSIFLKILWISNTGSSWAINYHALAILEILATASTPSMSFSASTNSHQIAHTFTKTLILWKKLRKWAKSLCKALKQRLWWKIC